MNDLYMVNELSASGNKIEALIMFRAEHAVFAGHFPGQPIVPGVCMIRIVQEVLSHHNKMELRLASADTIKFLSVIDPRPNHAIKLVIETRLENGAYHSKSVLSRDEVVYFKFNGIFEVAL